MPHLTRSFAVAVLAACLAAACAAPVRERPAEVRDASRQTFNSPAVVELSREAREALAAYRFDHAAQLLERAIRIEPRNGALWHELAQVRYHQGDYEQAVQLANRSNALATNRGGLKKKNEELIQASRKALDY